MARYTKKYCSKWELGMAPFTGCKKNLVFVDVPFDLLSKKISMFVRGMRADNFPGKSSVLTSELLNSI